MVERSAVDGGDTPPVVIETGTPIGASVIWLHGLGADGHDFAPIVPEFSKKLSCATRFIFPHAPFRPVTINNGYVMRAWYDMSLSGDRYAQNESHIQESVAAVQRIVETEQRRGIDTSRIVVAGFSQGGVIALVAGLTYPSPLAGIVVLSAPIPDISAICARSSGQQAKTAIFLAHGRDDPMVPLAYGEATHVALAKAGYRVHWQTYPMTHTVCPEEVDAIAKFLSDALI